MDEPRGLPQVFDLVVQPETRIVIERLAQRQGTSPEAMATQLLQVGAQAELVRQRWLAGMRTLSPRMQEAALVLLEGNSYRQVAAAMGITYWTAQEYCEKVVHAFGQSGKLLFWRRYCFLVDVYSRQELMPD
jgi:DNA-binding CsgD family transcriptional regulator